MFFIILGLLAVAISFAIGKAESPIQRFAKVIRTVGFVVALLGFLTSCIVQIDAGQVGVQKLFGKVQTRITKWFKFCKSFGRCNKDGY